MCFVIVVVVEAITKYDLVTADAVVVVVIIYVYLTIVLIQTFCIFINVFFSHSHFEFCLSSLRVYTRDFSLLLCADFCLFVFMALIALI